MTVRPAPNPTAVFLNVPFDRAYEPLFVALIRQPHRRRPEAALRP